ncbi:hypothetical protein ACW9HF_15075 [Nocardia gipuzkoensis]
MGAEDELHPRYLLPPGITFDQSWNRLVAKKRISTQELDEQSIRELRSSIERIQVLLDAIANVPLSTSQKTLEEFLELRRRLHQQLDHALNRLAYLQAQEQMAELKGAVEEKVSDPQVRQELSELVSEFGRQQQELARELQAREDDAAKELRRLEVQERKWRMRKSLLDREPAAVLIGALLLSGITLALIVGMFIHTPAPDILANAFLLILGFFFGQTTSGRGKQSGDTIS